MQENKAIPQKATFSDTKQEGVFNWYPYVEGFSLAYIREKLRKHKDTKSIYDPFGGCGTTQLAASLSGLESVYSEINPFMDFVASTKINSVIWALDNFDFFSKKIDEYKSAITGNILVKTSENISLDDYFNAFPERDFFVTEDIKQLLAAKNIAYTVAGDNRHLLNILLLACASNVVKSSNMTRRADLRRRKNGEYKNRVVNVPFFIHETVSQFLNDVSSLPNNIQSTKKISSDCRHLPSEFENAFDLVVTSPPYLNGTNYIRNTKLELWFLDFIQHENELGEYRKNSITAGITNVACTRPIAYSFAAVEKVALELDNCAKDKRIPHLIRAYFSDMYEVFVSIRKCMKSKALFYLDIGDSVFYGVHVPTDRFLSLVAEEAGLKTTKSNVLAKRYSRDKSELIQVELVLEKV